MMTVHEPTWPPLWLEPKGFDHSNQERAWLEFIRLPLPSRKSEQWRYTSSDFLLSSDFYASQAKPKPILPQALENTYFAWFLDGKLQPSPDLEALERAGLLRLSPLDQLPLAPNIQNDSFDYLALAQAKQGLEIEVLATLDKPLHFSYSTQAEDTQYIGQQQAWTIHPGAKCQLIEDFQGEATAFTTLHRSIDIQAGAELDYYGLQLQGKQSYFLERLSLNQAQHSLVRWFTLDLSGRLIRREINQVFEGERAQFQAQGTYLAQKNFQIDNRLCLTHVAPHCESHQTFRGIVSERAVGNYQGKIIVKPKAQQSIAHQHHANLLLSESARTHIQPQLEIYADEVQCTHGTSTGSLDKEAFFYLISRGLTPAEAQALLLKGFMTALLPNLELAVVRTAWEKAMTAQLATLPVWELRHE